MMSSLDTAKPASRTLGCAPGFLCGAAGFFLAFRSCLTFLFFQSDPQLGTAVRLGATLGWLLIIVGYSIIDPPRRVVSAQCAPLRWIVLYLTFAGLSLLWTAASPGIATGYWIGIACDVTSVYLLLRYPNVEDHAGRIMAGFVIGTVIVATVAWFSPVMDDLRLGNEEFLHPNLIGFEFGIGTLLAAYLAQSKKLWIWVAIGLGVTMVRSLSKGTIIAFLFSGLYYLLRGLKVTTRARFWIGLVCSIVLASFWGLAEAYLDLYTQGNNVETLTGRTYIWTQSLDLAFDKPWFGHGFDSLRWVFPPFGGFQPNHAHNEFVQQLFAYGIIGMVIVVGAYWSFYLYIRQATNVQLKALATAILLLVLVRGLVDTDQFDLAFPLWLMTLLSVSLAGSHVSTTHS